MRGTAFSVAGAVGGVDGAAVAPDELPAALTCASCARCAAMPPRAIKAPTPTIAAHSRILGTAFEFIIVCSIVVVRTTYTLGRVKDSTCMNAAKLEPS
jgi:hypothetical protein